MKQTEQKNLPALPAPSGDSYSKPQAALVMFPKIGKMTTVGRKIFNVLAKTMQQQVVDNKNKNESGLATDHEFAMPLRELLDGVQTEKSNLYQLAKTRLKEMQSTVLEYETPVEGCKNPDWKQMNLLATVGIRHDKETKVPFVTWSYPKDIFKALTENGLYTTLNNALIAELKTYAAVALYEICVKYKTAPGGVTTKREVSWWVNALSESPPHVDKKTGVERVRDWAHFKDRQLKTAIEEINTKTDIVIAVLDYKTGKKITHAQFSVARKASSSVEVESKLSETLAQKVNECGLRISDVLQMKVGGLTEDFLALCIQKFSERLNNKDLPPILSKIAYFKKVAEELGEQVGSSSKTAIATEVVAANAFTPTEQPKPAMTYKDERRAQIKDEFKKLLPEEQKPYAHQALAVMRSRKLPVAASVSRKVESGEWLSSPLLFIEMVNLFAVERFGIDWALEKPTTEQI